MKTLKFTIDSHLLQELGERLVGRPHIAVGELVKNAYDADANHCEIIFSKDEIEIWDDGHGMTFEEFRNFWMRIGTTNKLKEPFSKAYARPLTGSKGIGRLSVQFLARKVQIVTTSSDGGRQRLDAVVDWDEAIEAGDLTEAIARYETSQQIEKFAHGSSTGTKIILKNLNHEWIYKKTEKNTPIRALAREVWMLQPPLAGANKKQEENPDYFRIDLVSDDELMEQAFHEQLTKVLELWDAKIEGEVRGGQETKRCNIVVTFRDGDTYEVATPLERAQVNQCSFEIRIFKLYGKQPEGITVETARAYFREFGGVHVYDGGFRLPYYGIEQDWLGIQLDHSHRLSISSLLPQELNVPLAMHDLPTMQRIFGVVQINTARELRRASITASRAGEFLKINIGRDRLVDNPPYQELRRIVRWSIDYYTTRFQLRQEREVSQLRPIEPPESKLERLRETIHQILPQVPMEVHTRLIGEVDDYYGTVQRQNRYVERQTALLAPLAAAGLASLAFEHESNRQIQRLKRLVRQLSRLSTGEDGNRQEIDLIVSGFRSWIEQHQEARSLFSPLANREDREDFRQLRAKATVELVLRNTRSLLRSLKTELSEFPDDLLLPLGKLADWQALFQNVFVNASNAMLDSSTKRLRIGAGTLARGRNYLRISDTGIGVDLEMSDELFDPFVRRLAISDERKSLGLGGMGLGLTIARMICETRKCKYGFVEPESGFSTSFELTWKR